MEEKRGNGLLWALVGCGGLLFVGLCLALGVGAYLFVKEGAPGPTDPTGYPIANPPQVPPQVPPQIPPQIPPQVPPGGRSFTLEADVRRITGTLAGRVSTSCRFEIEELVGADGPRCRTQIFCDSVHVYGGPRSGYFTCRVDVDRRSVSGSDQGTTSEDTDAAMSVDTDARTLQIRDDATGMNGEFSLEATIR